MGRKPKTTTLGKQVKAAVQATNNRKGKQKKAACSSCSQKKVKAVERVPVRMLVTPCRPDMPMDFGSEEDEPKVRDRKSDMASAREIKDNLKVKSEDAYRSINVFLERNGLHADNPYEDAMQKLVNGEASLITTEIRRQIFEYIKQRIMDLRHYLNSLLIIQEWDDEIAYLIVKAIEETHLNLGVRLIELEDIACLARSIPSESVKEFQVAKGGFVRDCLVFWLIENMNYLYNGKNAEEWIKNPTTSFTSIDPEKSGKYGGVPFKIPRSVN